MAPLSGCRARFCCFQCSDQRTTVGCSQPVEKILIDLEIKHHLQPFSSRAEVFHVRLWHYVRLSQNNGGSLTPTQEFSELAQHVVLLDRPGDVIAFGRDHKGYCIHPEPRNSELKPKAHDFENLGLYFGIACIQIRLKVVKTMEVPALCGAIASPG